MRKLLLPLLLLISLIASATPSRAQQQLPINSGSVLADVSHNTTFKVFLNQNITNITLTAPTIAPGLNVTFIFQQNATGGYTVAFGGNVGGTCSVTSTANSTSLCSFVYDASTNSWFATGGGGGTWPGYPTAGVVQSTGIGWGSSLAAPTGALVGTTDTQTLTNKTVDGVAPATFAFLDPTSSIQTQLNAKAPLASPTFTGTVTMPTMSLGGNVSAPSAITFNFSNITLSNFPTLNQNTSGTAANLSGTPALPNGTTATTQTTGDNTTKIATDAFVIANAGGGSLPSGVAGQTPVNTGGGATTYAATSPTLPLGNGGALVSLASGNYSILCDSATVATGIQDRGKVIKVGTGGANNVVVPDLSGTGCSGMYGVVENATSSTITTARQTSDTFNVFGPSQGAPTTGATTFTLAAGQWATYSPSESSTAYDIRIYAPVASGGTTTIASGTASLGTTAIASGACATVVTVSASGVATTDSITANPNGDPTGITGYGPSASGSLYIWKYPTANNVNFKVCNNTSGSITPGALTLNWRVTR